MGKKPIVSVTYENEAIAIKNSLPLKVCVTFLLCGPRADLWPFYGFLCIRFFLYIERKPGSCLLWVMSTEISVDIAVDIADDTRSIVGRQSVDTLST